MAGDVSILTILNGTWRSRLGRSDMLRLDFTRSIQSDMLYYSERNQRVVTAEKAAFEDESPLMMAASAEVLSV